MNSRRKPASGRSASPHRELPSSAACWKLRERPALPALLGRGVNSLDQVVLGRPLQWELRSGASVGPGAGTSCPAPGDLPPPPIGPGACCEGEGGKTGVHVPRR